MVGIRTGIKWLTNHKFMMYETLTGCFMQMGAADQLQHAGVLQVDLS